MANKYKALQAAEMEGEKNPWIRTRYIPEGGSTAFGPGQVTMGKAVDYANRQSQTGLSDDSVKFIREILTPMQEKMAKYGGKDMKPGFEAYDYGGTGNFDVEKHSAAYDKMVEEMIKYDWEKSGGDVNKFLKTWRGQDPEKRYIDTFNRIYNEENKQPEIPKQGRLDDLMEMMNPFYTPAAEAAEFGPPKVGRLDEVMVLQSLSRAKDFITKESSLKETAEASLEEQLDALKSVPKAFIAAAKFGDRTPEEYEAMKKVAILPLKSISRVSDAIKAFAFPYKDQGRGESALKTFLMPSIQEEGYAGGEIAKKLNPKLWVVAGILGTGMDILSTMVATGSLVRNMISGYQTAKFRGASRQLNKIVDKVADPMTKHLDAQGFFPKEWTWKDKLGRTKAFIDDSLRSEPRVGDALLGQQTPAKILGEKLLSRAGQFAIGQSVKVGGETAKIIAIEGASAIIDLAGKQVTTSLDALSKATQLQQEGGGQETRPKDFKTAEEYVASKTTGYHGTSAGEDVVSLKPSEGGELGAGVYFSRDINVAKKYGTPDTREVPPNKFATIPLDIGNLRFKRMKMEEFQKLRNSYFDEQQTILKNEGKDPTMDWTGENYRNAIDKFENDIKSQGFDGIYVTEAIGGDQGVVFPSSANKIKTKSQLISEWEAAKDAQGMQPPPPDKPTAVSPGEEEEPIQKVMKALKSAKSVRGKQETIYKKARGEKLAKMVSVKKEGEAGFYAQKGALKGDLPKVEYESIRQNLSQKDIDSLYSLVQKSPHLSPWDKISAQEGLSNLLGTSGAKVPTEDQIKKLNKVFGKEFTDVLLEKRPLIDKIVEAGLQIANIPRSLMSSLDLSFGLRQGVFSAFKNRKQFMDSWKKQFSWFGSEKSFQEEMKVISENPNYEIAIESGLAFTEMDSLMTEREEAFMSQWTDKIPLVRASARAYTGFANKFRMDLFTKLFDDAKNLGLNPEEDMDLTKAIADFVNNATGRGKLPSELEKSTGVLSALFFSPRLIASRLNLLNPAYYMTKPPFVRKEALKTALYFLGAGLTIITAAKLMGAEIGTDIRSSDFGKIKIGRKNKKYTRIDIWGGFQPYIRMLGQLVTGEYVSSTTGKVVRLGEGYKPLTRLEILQRQVGSKFSPAVSFFIELLKGQTWDGKKVNVPKELGLRLIPMVIQDLYDIVKDNPEAAPAIILAPFGVGIQTYKPQKKTKF